jgi:aspartyl-tRNA(Asn)/glutamyl-tRNA(Gln) amidotransferase subunit A
MIDVTKLSLIEVAQVIKEKKISCVDLVKKYIERVEKYKSKNAVLEVFDSALEIAKEWDEKIKKGETLPELTGVPIMIKDAHLYKGHKATCGSKFMENYVSQFTSSAIKRLIDAGAIILGRCNMDEFSMGGSCENSAFGPCFNAHCDDNRVAGGSSGGSAVAVALSLCAAALGSDTGGSIRQPSAFNGTVGFKGTYGRVPRHGLVAYASSLDHIGPITKTVEDAALLMSVMSGYDHKDMLSIKEPAPDFLKNLKPALKGIKVGVITEVEKISQSSVYFKKYYDFRNWLREHGAQVVELSVKNYELALPVYYTIVPAEASSNLGRFDGIKYTTKSPNAKTLEEIYIKSRSEGFGKEVKRRILIGNLVLSSGYHDEYYVKAKAIRKMLINEMAEAFTKCDVIYMPTTPGEAFKVGEKLSPVELYMEDIFTIIANLAEIPAVSIPFGKGETGLPLGLQLLAKKFDEQTLLNVATYIQNNFKEGK